EPVRTARTRDQVANFARLPLAMEQRLFAAYSALPPQERQDFDFDRLVLGVAAEQAVSEVGQGSLLLTLVRLHFDGFLNERRLQRYLAACQALDDRLRRRLVLVLRGLPKGVPNSRVLDCTARVHPFCHGVGLQSDDMDVPALDPALLNSAIVV